MFAKKYILIVLGVFFISSLTHAQFGNLLKKAKEKVKRKVERKIDKGMDKGIDEADKAISEDVAGKNDKGKNTKDKTESAKEETKNTDSKSPNESVAKNEQLKLWSKYNFVPGDKIIFEDDLSSEESGEFPSRWDLTAGNAENASLGNDNIINFVRDGTIINPLMDKESYLPEVFTLEFDAYFDKEASLRSQKYELRFFSGISWNRVIANSNKRMYYIGIGWNKVQMHNLGDEN